MRLSVRIFTFLFAPRLVVCRSREDGNVFGVGCRSFPVAFTPLTDRVRRMSVQEIFSEATVFSANNVKDANSIAFTTLTKVGEVATADDIVVVRTGSRRRRRWQLEQKGGRR